ncbi:MAG: protein kinase [Phycisphaeraceae bacterium]|nr:protein kinase [Phycisphaeraceae bacterium]
MDQSQRERIKRIFEEARGMPREQRDAFVRSACGEGADAQTIAAEVRGLLEALDSAEGFLEGATGGAAAIAAGYLADAASERVGSRIGPYKLLELIGEGGFGEVYMAEQEQPIRRRVALKIIKLGMDTKQVIARFEQERQALAMMDHPCIAKVLDAGATPAGRPYFVMELVRGEPITKFCDEHRLSVAERIDLFRQVCGAVQHAHQKGIIHRDIKPSNVLVTIADGDRPLPKVIDFGIAKATHSRLTEKTLFTEFRQMIGTPEYMSPEQCGQGAVGGLDIDTRSDVYSLGVLLYELLTGVTPFDSKRLRSAAFGELQRIIREDDPPRPSTRLSTIETLRDVASHRRTEPSRLRGMIRGELDWVVMRCLEKDRVRRYLSANDLAEDLGRFQRREPLQAGPPSAAYRTRKFVARHRSLVVTAATIVIAMLLGLIGTTFGAVWALRERNDAIDAGARAVTAQREAERAAAAETVERERADLSAAQARLLAYRLGINTALGYSRAGDIDSLRSVLQQMPRELRGWEWEHLRWRSDMSVRTLDSPPDTCAICSTPDGRRVLTRTPDGKVRVFDRESGLLIRSFATDPACPANSNGMVTSPDGQLLLVSRHFESTHTRIIGVWRLSDGAKLWERDIGSGVFGEFSAEGDTVLLPYKDGLEVVDSTTGATVRSLRLGIDRPLYARALPSASSALVFGSEGYLLVDLVAGRVVQPIGGDTASVDPADPRHVYTWQPSRGFRMFDLQTGEFKPLDLALNTVDYWPDMRVIGDGQFSVFLEDSGLHTLSTTSAQPLSTLHVPISRFGFKPMADGRTFCAVERSGRVSLWSVARWNQPFVVSEFNRGLYGGQVNHAATRSTVFGWGDVSMFDVDTGESLWSAYAEQGGFHAAAFTRDDRLLAVGGRAERVVVLDAHTGAVRVRLRAPANAVLSALAWSPAGDRLVVGCFDGRVFCYPAIAPDTEPELWPDEHGGPVGAVRFSPDGRLVVTASDSDLTLKDYWHTERGSENSVRIRRADTGQLTTRIGDPSQPHGAIDISPDGSRLVVGSGRSVSMYRMSDGQELKAAPLECPVKAVAIHPDASRIAVYCADGEIRLYDGNDLEFIAQFRVIGYFGQSIRFSEDGRSLVAACGYTPIMAFESGPPRNEEQRYLIRRATVATGDLFSRSGYSAEEVCEALAAAPGLPKAVRDAALQQARIRGDDPLRIYNDVWIECRKTDQPLAFYEKHVRRAMAGARTAPTSPLLRTTLAIAQMRALQNEAAIASCAESDRLIGDRPTVLRSVNASVASICLSRLGRVTDAQATAQRARQIAADTGLLENVDVRQLLLEAEALIPPPEEK